MTFVARGNSFPIRTFFYKSRFINIHESAIYCISPQFGSQLCFEPERPIIDATLLNDGTLIVLDGNIYALKLQDDVFIVITTINCSNLDIREIASKGQRFIALTNGGQILYYEFDNFEIILKHVLYQRRPTESILAAGILEDNFIFCFKTDLENLNLALYYKNTEGLIKVIETIELSDLKTIQDLIFFEDEMKIDFILFDGDLITKITWNKVSRSHHHNVYKIKTRHNSNMLSFIISGEKYMINDVICPSFILFSASSEVTLGVLIENSVRFWTVNCETSSIESALYSEEMCIFYINSREKSGFFSFDTKNLKMILYSQTESFSTSSSLQVSENLISSGQCLISLPLDKTSVYSLDEGITPNFKLLTDSFFRGISKLWVIKKHHQDLCHEYLIMASENSTLVFKLEEYTLVDITNILNINRNLSTKLAFNLKNSSYFVNVTAKNVIVLDLSKIDSVDSGMVKFEFNNTEGPWDLVYHHDFYLFCFSQKTKIINIFQLKSRARDINLVVPLGKLAVENLGIAADEFTSLIGRASDNEFEIIMTSFMGFVYHFVIDSTFKIKKNSTIDIGETIESLESIKTENFMELYAGTRYGALLKINISNSSFSKIDQVGKSPIKLLKLLNNTLMAHCHDASVLIRENSKECIKRRIIDWGSEAAVELVYGLGKSFIAGIKDDNLVLMTVPIVSENTLSKRLLFYNSKFTAFLAVESRKWLIGCINIQEKKNYLKLFDYNGIETSSVDRGSDEIIGLLPIDLHQKTIVVVSVTRDKLQSKMEMIDIESLRIETRGEYIFDGAISKIKILDRFLYYSVNEEFFALEICPFSKKFLGRTSYHFRNLIMDFDICDKRIVTSCFSDGLDVLSLVKESNGNIKLISIRYYLNVKDIDKAEAGLITALNLVGFISQDIIEVFYSYLRLKYPSNYNTAAAYINNLRPRNIPNFENYWLDFELMLCAFQEKNSSAAKQMLLRLEEANPDSFINLARCLCAFGIPNFLTPITSYKAYFTHQFVSNHRMIAHLTQFNEHNFGNLMNDQLVLAMRSHRDINNAMIQNLDYETLKDFVLFPNFILNFDSFVHKLILEHEVALNVKLRYLAFLTSSKIFIAENNKTVEENLKYCFNLLLYVRTSPFHEQLLAENSPEFLNLPIFHNTEDKLLKAIRILLEY